MAEPTPTPADPAPAEVDPAHQAQFNAMFNTAMTAFIAEHKPAPEKTAGRPGGLTDWLFGNPGQKAT
jgi:hypothetical protein